MNSIVQGILPVYSGALMVNQLLYLILGTRRYRALQMQGSDIYYDIMLTGGEPANATRTPHTEQNSSDKTKFSL